MSSGGWSRLRGFGVVAAMALVVGCSEDSTGPQEDPTLSHTVDASTDTVFVAFGSTATTRSVADFATSSDWDLGFFSTTVLINGAGIGPAGVTVHCVCQNAGASNDDILEMTPTTELADFEAVTSAQIPSGAAAWSSTAFDTDKWYKYDIVPGTHAISPTFQVYLVKRGSDVFKVQLTGYYGPAGESRQISIRYARLAG